MIIGLYFDCYKKSGGIYQYALNLLEAVKSHNEHSYVVFNLSKDFPFTEYSNLKNWKIINLIPLDEGYIHSTPGLALNFFSFRRKFNLFVINFLRRLHLYSLEIKLTSLNARRRAKIFSRYNIDLMLYHTFSELSFLTEIPGIVPIHDLHHKIHPELPEVSQFGQYRIREYLINNIKKKAYKIIVNTKTCKEDLVRLYNIHPDKIHIMPFPPASYINSTVTENAKQKVKEKFNLPNRYVFYPAQFWPHKNHRNLVKAIGLLRDEGEDVHAVFVGSKREIWGEFERICKLIDELSLSERIHFLGYVDNADMPILFDLATAVTIIPLFGYGFTYPVLEAWKMKRPLICANARESREQVEDAALFANPTDPKDIALKIKMLVNNKKLSERLVRNGLKQLQLNSHENLSKKIGELITMFDNEILRKTVKS